MLKKKFKISICVVSMNRLHQLMETLPQNIADNADYEELEYVLLDYNSKDGMEEWVKENLGHHILTGRLKYFKTTEPVSWSPSHSKNLAFKLAQGEILCNIWADYYTGFHFAQYVNEVFNADENVVLTPIVFPKIPGKNMPPGDVLGKVCVRKVDFELINGFDERISKHGFEDYDFVNRLELIGLRRVLIEDDEFLKFIGHDDDERYAALSAEGMEIFINHITPFESHILFLYENGNYKWAYFIDNYAKASLSYTSAYRIKKEHFEYTLKKPGWKDGFWKEENDLICFFSPDERQTNFQKILVNNDVALSLKGKIFQKINDNEIISDLLKFDHFYSTRAIMEENLEKRRSVVNPDGYGEGKTI